MGLIQAAFPLSLSQFPSSLQPSLHIAFGHAGPKIYNVDFEDYEMEPLLCFFFFLHVCACV